MAADIMGGRGFDPGRRSAIQGFQQRRLPLVLAVQELPTLNHEMLRGYEAPRDLRDFFPGQNDFGKAPSGNFPAGLP